MGLCHWKFDEWRDSGCVPKLGGLGPEVPILLGSSGVFHFETS